MDKIVEQPVAYDIEKTVHRYVEVPVEKVIEKPVYIERLQEVPRETQRVVEVDLKT